MNELIDKIKQNGYWKIVIRPAEFIENRISSREECKRLIEENQIRLRGWYYPHIDGNKGIVFSGNDNVSSSCNWEEGGTFEYWKFYQNGQFIHYLGMIEDYRLSDKDKRATADSVRLTNVDSPTFLSIINVLYLVTEAFYFAAKLAKKDMLGEDAQIEIELGNVYKRTLFFWGEVRLLFNPYTCEFDSGENIVKKVQVSKTGLVENHAALALDTTIDILKDFGWYDVNKSIFAEDQKKLLERRL